MTSVEADREVGDIKNTEAKPNKAMKAPRFSGSFQIKKIDNKQQNSNNNKKTVAPFVLSENNFRSGLMTSAPIVVPIEKLKIIHVASEPNPFSSKKNNTHKTIKDF